MMYLPHQRYSSIMRDGESLNQKKSWPLSSALRPFCSAKPAVVGRYLQITKSYQRIGGKDIITPPKTDKSIRRVLLPDFLSEESQQYLSGLEDAANDKGYGISNEGAEVVIESGTLVKDVIEKGVLNKQVTFDDPSNAGKIRIIITNEGGTQNLSEEP